MRKLFAVISLLLVLAAGSASLAAECDRLVLGDAPEDVILGTAGVYRCFWVGNRFLPVDRACVFLPTGSFIRQLGVCWRGKDGAWRYKLTRCTTSTPRTDYFQLNTRGGNDRVAVLQARHLRAPEGALLPFLPDQAVFCGRPWEDAPMIAPWREDFAFSIHATLGSGSDLFQGSPNGDVVATNYRRNYPGSVDRRLIFTSSPADRSSPPDLACGEGGDDHLYGDEDNDHAGGREDWLDGGPGNDRCDGEGVVPFLSDRPGVPLRGDLWRDCEVHMGALPDPGLIDCSATDDPLHEWR